MVGKKRILLVDDDEYMIEGLKTFLERRGYDILVANDGHQGKQMIASEKPDLVILDILMPRLGGFPVLESCRGKTNVPPIIVVTANEGLRPKLYAEHLGEIGRASCRER